MLPLYEALLESAPDAFIVADRTGAIRLVNAQAERLFGYTRAELLTMTVDALVPERLRTKHPGYRHAFAADPKLRPMGAGLDLWARRKDGSELPVEISLSPLQTPEGLLVSAAIRDISERRRLEAERVTSQERQREVERLRQMDAIKTRFMNTAAHELRTPLLPIRAQLMLLAEQLAGHLTTAQRGNLAILERNVERLSALVEDLLDSSRYQAGRLPLNLQSTDLAALVREAADSFQESAATRGLQLQLDAAGPIDVTADGKRLTQVVYNLLSNAVKFTPRGGTVRISVRRLPGPPGWVEIAVADDGSGLHASDAERLFQPFVQVHDPAQVPERGSGLGLYISRGIVEGHGGAIGVTSPGPGRGSTFTVRLPVAGPQTATASPGT